jgi:hypothetical protein
MGHNTMEHHGHGSTWLTLLTVMLYFIARFGVTEWAGIATILAAISTFGLNLFRYLKERKKKTNE